MVTMSAAILKVARAWARWCATGAVIAYWPDAPESVRRYLATGDEEDRRAAERSASWAWWNEPMGGPTRWAVLSCAAACVFPENFDLDAALAARDQAASAWCAANDGADPSEIRDLMNAELTRRLGALRAREAV
jgi:hypothetical protein